METWVNVLQGDPTARASFLDYLNNRAAEIGKKVMTTDTDVAGLNFAKGEVRTLMDLQNLITSTKEAKDV